MVKSNQKINVYITLRPATNELPRAWDSVYSILAKYGKKIDYKIAGFACDKEASQLTLSFAVPISDSHEKSVSTLQCIHNIFASFYNYLPCYSGEPTLNEQRAAEDFIKYVDSPAKTETISTPTHEGQKVYA